MSATEEAAQGGAHGPRRGPGLRPEGGDKPGGCGSKHLLPGVWGDGAERASEVLASTVRKAILSYKCDGFTRVPKLFYIRLNKALPEGLAKRSSTWQGRQL